jgi:hypothetical protein
MINIPKNNFLLFIIPGFTFVFSTLFALIIHNSYAIDPDYAYLFNGLNFIRGESFFIVHVDHPGTPLQVLIGIFIILISKLRGAEDFTADVLKNPEMYIQTIIIVFSFFYSLVLFFAGKQYLKYRQSLLGAFLIQLSFLLFATVSITSSKLFSETLLPVGSFLIILVTIERTWGTMKDWVYALLSGLLLGIFIATKITFIPIFLLPLIVVRKWRNKLIYFLTMVAAFFISILPVIERLTSFKSFMVKIATHEGTYGSGKEEIINSLKLFKNLWGILQIEYSFTLIFLLSFIALMIAFRKNKFGFLKDKETRVLFGLFLAFLLQLVIVGKHVGFRYMIPSLLFGGFALSIILNHFEHKKLITYAVITLTLFLSIFYNVKMVTKAMKLNDEQEKTYSFIEKTISSNDAVMVVTKEPWLGSPFISQSIMFGKLYTFRQGGQYGDILMHNFPDRYSWVHNKQQYQNWQLSVMPDILLAEHKQLYLYIQTDNPKLYAGVMDDFSENMKYISKESIDMKLVYSNAVLDEEIYRIQLKGNVDILPKYSMFCDFETVSNSDNNSISTSDSTISFAEGWRLNESHAFAGKRCVCITPENAFGISAHFNGIKQFDFFRISIYCKRSSFLQESVIGIKTFTNGEEKTMLEGVSTATINGWEKLEHSYRIIDPPDGEKVEIFIWNNGTEPVYFDDLRIELF